MTRFRPVTEDVLVRVSAALDAIAQDPELPRTKRSVERVSGLSHDAVARAFRQDRELGTPQRLNARFAELTDGGGDRRSPIRQELAELRERHRERGRRIRELEADVAALAQIVLATELSSSIEEPFTVVPLRHRRAPRK